MGEEPYEIEEEGGWWYEEDPDAPWMTQSTSLLPNTTIALWQFTPCVQSLAPFAFETVIDFLQASGAGRLATDGNMAIAKRDDRVQPYLPATRSATDPDGGGGMR